MKCVHQHVQHCQDLLDMEREPASDDKPSSAISTSCDTATGWPSSFTAPMSTSTLPTDSSAAFEPKENVYISKYNNLFHKIWREFGCCCQNIDKIIRRPKPTSCSSLLKKKYEKIYMKKTTCNKQINTNKQTNKQNCLKFANMQWVRKGIKSYCMASFPAVMWV